MNYEENKEVFEKELRNTMRLKNINEKPRTFIPEIYFDKSRYMNKPMSMIIGFIYQSFFPSSEEVNFEERSGLKLFFSFNKINERFNYDKKAIEKTLDKLVKLKMINYEKTQKEENKVLIDGYVISVILENK